jgi:hypothetical protein
MIEPMQREYELARIAGIPECARLLAAYREELLAASAQSAEPQEEEVLLDIRHRLYAEAVERSVGWSAWTPNEAYKTGFEGGIDATFDILRARLAMKRHLAAPAQSAEPQEAEAWDPLETLAAAVKVLWDDVRMIVTKDSACSRWHEDAILALAAIRARLASKPSREEGPDLRTALDLLGEIMSYAETWANLPQNLRNRAEAYLHPSTEFVKLPKVVRDNYLEMAAELAVIHGLYGGQKMPVIKNIGFYKESEKVGYVAWIETIDGTYFVGVDGKISKPEM